MPRLNRMTTTSCLALFVWANAASAELSANDIWTDWKDYMQGFGYEISGVERDTGNGLNVSDVVMTVAIPEENGAMKMRLGALEFIEQGDGSVQIQMSEEISFAFDVDPDNGEEVSGTILYKQTEPVFVASGTPDDLTYTYNVARAEMIMEGLTVEGVSVGADVFGFNVVTEGVTSSTSMKKETLRVYDQSMAVDNISYSFNFQDPESNDGKLDMRGSATGISFAGAGQFPENIPADNASAMIAAGFGFDGSYDFQSGSSDVSFQSPDGSGTMNSTSQGGTLSVTMSEAGLGYVTETRGLSVNALFSTLPIPMSFEAQRAAFNMLLPTIKGPDTQDIGLLFSMENFSMADTLWGMFDPTGQLPRDPATLTVDLSGKAKLLFDYLDPAQSAVLEETGAAPGELHALTLNTLLLEMAGAKLTGAGDFTFDNSDTTSFDGMPRPEGAIDLQLLGGNGLLDKLVSMGLLPQDQAMSTRMMMGVFAQPGDGPDALVSRIEVNEQGHVLANGQRLR